MNGIEPVPGSKDLSQAPDADNSKTVLSEGIEVLYRYTSGLAAWDRITRADANVLRGLLRGLQDAERLAKNAATPPATISLPEEAPPGLLMSMAIRYDHALGQPGFYDAISALTGGVGHSRRLDSTLGTMRQLYEEVSGHGFYRPEHEAHYLQLRNACMTSSGPPSEDPSSATTSAAPAAVTPTWRYGSEVMKLMQAAFTGDRSLAAAYARLMLEKMEADSHPGAKYIRARLEQLEGARSELVVRPAAPELADESQEKNAARYQRLAGCELDWDSHYEKVLVRIPCVLDGFNTLDEVVDAMPGGEDEFMDGAEQRSTDSPS